MYSCDHRYYYVYILTNRSQTLYVGVTNNLSRRVWEHKRGEGSEFCKRYKIDRLVYYESFDDVQGDQSGEADQGVASDQEDSTDRFTESYMARLECGVVRAASVPAGEMHRSFGG
jgi:predicted GIY-YIG superfamily endonuclease